MSMLYSEDGMVLLSADLDLNETEIVVADGCRIIARKAFMYQDHLERIILPESLERIEDFAFSCTSLSELVLPDSLRRIGMKAFYQCKMLRRVCLNEGLLKMGAEAFAQTSLEELTVPTSVRYLGQGFIFDTPLSKQEHIEGFKILSGNTSYRRDEAGALYRQSSIGSIMTDMTSQTVESHTVERGTIAIARGAYKRCEQLRTVHLPDKLEVLGKRAFDRVVSLENVEIPGSLEYLGECAFRKTSIRTLRLPKSLRFMGESALLTGEKGVSTLQSISVDSECKRFFVEDGFLIQRQPWGGHGVVYFGAGERVAVPRSVRTIGSYCIACEQTIKSLHLHGGLTRIHPLAVAPHCRIEEVVVDLNRPFCGSMTARIPLLDKKTFYSPTYSLFPTGNVNIRFLFSQSDQITYMSHKTYLRARTMLERLTCPQYLSEKYHELFTEALARKTAEVCVEFANHEYLKGFELLREFGFLDESNITEIIDRIRSLNNVVVTSYLLELRRKHYSHSDIKEDFSL